MHSVGIRCRLRKEAEKWLHPIKMLETSSCWYSRLWIYYSMCTRTIKVDCTSRKKHHHVGNFSVYQRQFLKIVLLHSKTKNLDMFEMLIVRSGTAKVAKGEGRGEERGAPV